MPVIDLVTSLNGKRVITIDGQPTEHQKCLVEFNCDAIAARVYLDGKRIDPPFIVKRDGHLLVRGVEGLDDRRR